MSEAEEDWRPRTMPTLLIATAARLLARVADAGLRDIGISVSQFSVLVPLKNGARLSQKELAGLAGVEQPSMAQLLARMERDGLIRREPDPSDGRSSLISLSESALARIGPARAVLLQGDHEALAGFDQADIDRLTVLLHRVIANVKGGQDCAPTDPGGAPPVADPTAANREA